MQRGLFIREVQIQKDEDCCLEYPFDIPAIYRTNKIIFNSQVTYFVGENGSGKSTLLEAIAIELGLNPEGGSKNFLFETKKTHSNLHNYIKLIKSGRRPKSSYFLRAESFYNLATDIDNLDEDTGIMYDAYGGKSLHEKSHGEAFLSLISNRFYDDGLYILDEPEAALSPMRQYALLKIMKDLTDGGAQFIIATHSPILMSFPKASIFSFDEDGLRGIKYEETEHYTFTKYFLENYQRCLAALFQ